MFLGGLQLEGVGRTAHAPVRGNSLVTGSRSTVPCARFVTLVPDIAGAYVIELRVFDGELWSAPAMLTLDVQ